MARMLAHECRLSMNVAAQNILRPLPRHLHVLHDPTNIHRPFTNAKTLMIRICAVDAEVLDLYYQRWGLTEYSTMIFTGMWSITCTLLSMLDGPRPIRIRPDDDISMISRVPDLFTRGCAYMERLARDMPSVRLVMQGLFAMAVKTERTIPPAAMRYFEGIQDNREQLKDVPVTTVLPVLPVIEEIQGAGLREDDESFGSDDGSGVKEGELTGLLESWSALSLD